MSKLTNSKLRRMIMQELTRIVGEDALVDPGSDAHVTGASDDSKVLLGKESVCEKCGGMIYEDKCMECGYVNNQMVSEGDCGCSTCAGCDGSSTDHYDDDNNSTDYSLDSMLGMGATSMHIDLQKHSNVEKHGHNNYMAKPALYKVAKYAQKLLHMIPDGYELDDWQRSKIAQISDDISEVYHSLDYDFYDDED